MQQNQTSENDSGACIESLIDARVSISAGDGDMVGDGLKLNLLNYVFLAIIASLLAHSPYSAKPLQVQGIVLLMDRNAECKSWMDRNYGANKAWKGAIVNSVLKTFECEVFSVLVSICG